MKTEAEIGMRQPYAGEYRVWGQHTRSGKDRKGSSLETSEGAWCCEHLDFGLWTLKQCENGFLLG